jgi:hypothetical protein
MFVSFCAWAQDDDVVFIEPVSADTLTTDAQPVGGWDALLKKLEAKICQGDTVGKKHEIEFWPIQVSISKSGVVTEVTYINHATGPIHRLIGEELKKIMWEPAKNRGVATPSRFEIWKSIYVNKRVMKARRREYIQSVKTNWER